MAEAVPDPLFGLPRQALGLEDSGVRLARRVGLVTNRTGICQPDVGRFLRFRLRITLLKQNGTDNIAIINVHLTTIRFYVKRSANIRVTVVSSIRTLRFIRPNIVVCHKIFQGQTILGKTRGR